MYPGIGIEPAVHIKPGEMFAQIGPAEIGLEPGLRRLPGIARGKLEIPPAGADIDPLLSEPLPLPTFEPKVEKPNRQPSKLRPLPQRADKPVDKGKGASAAAGNNDTFHKRNVAGCPVWFSTHRNLPPPQSPAPPARLAR